MIGDDPRRNMAAPAQVGDFIEVGNIFGEVGKIGFRASVLRTPDGGDVIIPNGELVGAGFISTGRFRIGSGESIFRCSRARHR
jgi:small-conductance mechanosensitive channel